MRIGKQWHLRMGLLLTLATGLVLFVTWSSAASDGGAQHVRWDIQSLTGGAAPGTDQSRRPRVCECPGW